MAHHKQLSSVGSVDFDPSTPSAFENSEIPWRKRVPFELIARGVAGVDEIAEYLEDSKVFFGLVSISIGSGSFKREKSIFIHFNGAEMKPLKRSKANKKKAAAQKLLSPYHAEIVMENKEQCTIDYVFRKLNHIFVSDTAVKGDTKFEIGSLKEEYKKKMAEAKKKVKAEKERLEAQKQRLLAQQDEDNKRIEDEKLKKEEEEQRRREAEEEEARRQAEEEARLQAEADDAAAEAERLRVEQEEAEQKAAAADEEEQEKRKAEEEVAKKKAKKKRKKKKKDDWSDDREWTGQRIVACIHAQTSPLNWAVFQPSESDIIPMAFGHGGLNDLRDALKPDQVQYGIMRLTFGEGRFRRSHWVLVCWSPDSMTNVDSQKLKKKRMADRMHHINYKGFMQKAIGPYGIEVLAEDYDMVTLEDFILRVRKRLVVDGADDFMNVESFQKALDAEKEHFEERKRKQEEEKQKRLALEKKLKGDAESSEEEEDVYDKDEQTKNRKKRKRKDKKEDGDEDDEEGGDDTAADKDTETETDVEAKTEDVTSDVTADEALDEFKEDLPGDTINLMVDTSEANVAVKKRRSTIGPDELKRRDVGSQLCFESITLVKRPDSDLVWVLVEPRLPSKK